jgi:hypothetical protein
VLLREWSNVVITAGLGGEDQGTHTMASGVLNVSTVELGNLGHGDNLDIETRGESLQELGLAEAASAAGWPREVVSQVQDSWAGWG